jgi:hypothetical protein
VNNVASRAKRANAGRGTIRGPLTVAAAVGMFCLLAVAPAKGALIVTLSDMNATAQINLDSQAGMSNWTVDGINNLNQQWFWYRVGNAGPERSIDTLTRTTTLLGTNTLTVTYVGAGFAIDIAYTLMGGTAASATADIAETIRVRNTGPSPVNFHFFQYSDFDLMNTPNDDTVQINDVVARQWDPTLSLSETSAIRQANHAEVNSPTALLAKLNDALANDLSDSIGPLGPGNVAWAFQWDQDIAAGRTFIISKDKQVTLTVPEPLTLALLAAGGLTLTAGRIRRRMR